MPIGSTFFKPLIKKALPLIKQVSRDTTVAMLSSAVGLSIYALGSAAVSTGRSACGLDTSQNKTNKQPLYNPKFGS